MKQNSAMLCRADAAPDKGGEAVVPFPALPDGRSFGAAERQAIVVGPGGA